jgi:hypothetical protein
MKVSLMVLVRYLAALLILAKLAKKLHSNLACYLDSGEILLIFFTVILTSIFSIILTRGAQPTTY